MNKPLHMCNNIDNYNIIPKTIFNEIVNEINHSNTK
jgi:hypothetical protein